MKANQDQIEKIQAIIERLRDIRAYSMDWIQRRALANELEAIIKGN